MCLLPRCIITCVCYLGALSHVSATSVHYHMCLLPRCIITCVCYLGALSHVSATSVHYHMCLLPRCIITCVCYLGALSHVSATSVHYHMCLLPRCIITCVCYLGAANWSRTIILRLALAALDNSAAPSRPKSVHDYERRLPLIQVRSMDQTCNVHGAPACKSCTRHRGLQHCCSRHHALKIANLQTTHAEGDSPLWVPRDRIPPPPLGWCP